MKEYTVKVFDDKTEWYFEGLLHREGGPAIEFVSGSKHWYKNGELHREGGAAIEYPNGDKYWYKNGKLHREGGPAIEFVSIKHWYLEGNWLTKEAFNKAIKTKNASICENKCVEVDGIKYKLVKI